MLRPIRITAVLACSAMLLSCAADTTPPDQGPATSPEQSPTESQFFRLQLDSAMTAETAIPLILVAGHDRLAAACDSTPDAAVRIINPLVSGDYLDVPCSVILNGTGETSVTMTSEPFGGSIGQAEQKLGLITFVMCGLFLGGTNLFMNYALCPRATTERDRKNCNHLSNGSSFALGLMCALPL
jgi:hypothetical protein